MTADRTAWRIAFAKQGGADLEAREVLQHQSGLPACQQLHFLQMACEKVSKAYLCWRGSDPATLQSSHAYIAKTIPRIAVERWPGQPAESQHEGQRVLAAVKKLARQIELLAPAVDDAGRSPANCEYPWEDSRGAVHIPAEHKFSIDILYAPAGRFLLKSLYAAIRQLSN